MGLLRAAVEKRRWDLAAHSIVLATASVLNNGDKPHVSKRGSDNPSPGCSGGSGVKGSKKNQGKRV